VLRRLQPSRAALGTNLSVAASAHHRRISAGGAADITARLIGLWLSERLASHRRRGSRQAPADGYTLLLVSVAQELGQKVMASGRKRVRERMDNQTAEECEQMAN
jgi:hypothetical protein